MQENIFRFPTPELLNVGTGILKSYHMGKDRSKGQPFINPTRGTGVAVRRVE